MPLWQSVEEATGGVDRPVMLAVGAAPSAVGTIYSRYSRMFSVYLSMIVFEGSLERQPIQLKLWFDVLSLVYARQPSSPYRFQQNRTRLLLSTHDESILAGKRISLHPPGG